MQTLARNQERGNALKISEILNAAADLIEEKGWLQKHLRDAEGRVCMVGALAEVSKPRYELTYEYPPMSFLELMGKEEMSLSMALNTVVHCRLVDYEREGQAAQYFLWNWLQRNEGALSITAYGAGIPAWNDTPGRTKEEVVKCLRRAAQDAAFHE